MHLRCVIYVVDLIQVDLVTIENIVDVVDIIDLDLVGPIKK